MGWWNLHIILELIDQWAGLHGTDAIPDNEERAVEGHEDIDRSTYNDPERSGSEVTLFIANMGHAIPDRPRARPLPRGKGRYPCRRSGLPQHLRIMTDGFGL